jgi:hypothetical protein
MFMEEEFQAKWGASIRSKGMLSVEANGPELTVTGMCTLVPSFFSEASIGMLSNNEIRQKAPER